MLKKIKNKIQGYFGKIENYFPEIKIRNVPLPLQLNIKLSSNINFLGLPAWLPVKTAENMKTNKPTDSKTVFAQSEGHCDGSAIYS